MATAGEVKHELDIHHSGTSQRPLSRRKPPRAMTNTPKQHHYCPRKYLTYFLQDGAVKLTVYDKVNQTHFKASPEDVGKEGNLYAVELPSGPCMKVETDLFGPIDSKGHDMLQKLSATEDLTPSTARHLSIMFRLFTSGLPRA